MSPIVEPILYICLISILLILEDWCCSFNDCGTFIREIQTRIVKAHPNLLFVHGWLIPEPGVLHVLMEKAELDLTTALQKGFLPLETRMKIAVDVANGLKAIHSENYVHQDLKADSILVSYILCNAHISYI